MLKTLRAQLIVLALAAATLVFAAPAMAQVSLTALGSPYAQNFDTLPASGSATWTNNSTIAGWYHARTGTGTTIVANDGSSNAGNLYSYGTGTNTDRAMGSIGSSNAAAGSFFWGIRLQNNTGATITSLDVAYVGEQWRNGGGTGLAQTVTFSYLAGSPTVTGSLAEFQSAGVTVASLNFTSPVFSTTAATLNGNVAPNRTSMTATISGLNIPNGAEIMLRWSDPDHPNNDHGLAIDDFSVTPQGTTSTNPSGVGNANPSAVAAGGSTLLTVAVTPGTMPPSTGLTVTGDLTTIGGAPGTSFFDDGTNGDVTPNDNTFSLQATVGLATTSGAKSLPVTITDTQLRTGTTSIGLTVTVQTLAIHTIQGNGNTSPFAGSVVATVGIVTGVKSNGFFLQTPDTQADADPTTSEGIFVFTGSAPPAAAAVGNSVTVQGTAQEFIPSADPNSPPVTEIGGSLTVTLNSSGNILPAAIVLTAADTNPAGSIEQLERFEGMRVQVNSLTTSAPTGGTVSEPNATSTSTGVFYGVITGIARPFREPGVEVPDPLPPGSPANVPRFDANPERLRVDTKSLVNSVPLNVTSGVVVTNLVGPLDYSFRTYTIDTDPASPPLAGPNRLLAPVRAPTVDEFTVASFNMERFFDTVNDAESDAVLTPAAFGNRLNKASLAIRNVLRSPDIIGVQEMEHQTTLQAVADKVNADAVAASQPNPNYAAFLVEGNDVGGIDSAFLVKTARVSVVDVTQFGKDTTYIDPNSGQPALLNDRPPLVLRALVNQAPHPPYAVTVIVNQLRSLLGVDDPVDGHRVRTKRRLQAEYLANFIQARQTADPTERIVSVGDYNAFQFNDGYVDSIGTIKGTPTPADQVVLASGDLVNPNLADLIDGVPADQRYSYSFDGNAQELDHVLVTTGPQNSLVVAGLEFGRMDSDFPESYRSDANRPERVSDHDPIVAYFAIETPPVCTTAVAAAGSMFPLDHGMRSVAIANISGTPTVTAICQDEPPNFENIPGWAIDGTGIGANTANVRAERSGTRTAPGDGRVYHIFFDVNDGHGGKCSGEVKVGVPLTVGGAAIDGGALYNSTTGSACVVPGSTPPS